jgi:hypothetical protein
VANHDEDYERGQQIGKLIHAVESLQLQVNGMVAEMKILTESKIKTGALLTTIITAISLFGGAMGGKIAHWFGFFNTK